MILSKDFYIDIKKINLAHKYILDRVHKCAYPKGRGTFGIVYALSGKAEYRFLKGEKVTVSTGDILFLSKNTAYSIITEKEFVHYTINFDIHEESKDNTVLEMPFFLPKIKNSEQIERNIRKIVSLWETKKAGYEIKAMGLLYELLYLMYFDNDEESFVPYRRLLTAREYIEQHFNEPITLTQLSNLSNMSVTNFRREWKKAYPESAMQYRDSLRLNYAKELLDSGYYTVCEIADKCGFEDTSYFVRFFKNKTGITPGALKKQYHFE